MDLLLIILPKNIQYSINQFWCHNSATLKAAQELDTTVLQRFLLVVEQIIYRFFWLTQNQLYLKFPMNLIIYFHFLYLYA